MDHRQPPPIPAFYLLGSIIAVLELGARAHEEARWVHLYYAKGLTPRAGLREPPQEHQQSVLPVLERRGTGDKYRQFVDLLANQLQKAAGIHRPLENFRSWASAVLSYQQDAPPTGIPTASLPQDAPIYTQGYLDQRRLLQPNRPPTPKAAASLVYHWDYHLGRLLPWIGEGNDPHLSPTYQLGLADQRALNPKPGKRQGLSG